MTRTYRNIDLQYARICQADGGRAVVIPTAGFAALSVEIEVTSGTAALFRVRARKANTPTSASPQDYDAIAELTPTTLITRLLPVESEYLIVQTTTAEASSVIANLHVFGVAE